MNYPGFITENQLDGWVRGNSQIAQGIIVELIWRLVSASIPEPEYCRFPLGDSIGQSGPDGELITNIDYEPFLPKGKSFWEIGTSIKPQVKATSDFKERTKSTPGKVRSETILIIVTPLSGRREWQYTWNKAGKAKWLDDRRGKNEWNDIHLIDGTILIAWLHCFPAVELWLMGKMNNSSHEIKIPTHHWDILRSIGSPPPLTPDLFLANREEACDKLNEVFKRNINQLKIETYYPKQVIDFISAYIANNDNSKQIEIAGSCLFICSIDAWNTITDLRDSHVLVANFDLEDNYSEGSILLEKARQKGHSVIYHGTKGGLPHPNRVKLGVAKISQIKNALVKAGYNEERARTISFKSGGNIDVVLRCLQNLSTIPEWVQGTYAAEIVILNLLGKWSEKNENDIKIVEKLSKKAYGEWIGKIREILFCPNTPLIQYNGIYRFVSRYEGWYALGHKIFDEYLDRFKELAVFVLKEKDPKFSLKENERFAASIYGKVLKHSSHLRKGLADTLALIGSHVDALTACSPNKAEAIAVLSVREILTDADWILWASLNDLITLFAEAAPNEFLSIVENTLKRNPCPFDNLFKQEGTGVSGWNYMTGLLWALESLAWDEEYLTRVIIILSDLAESDPGGKWANRPSNSLTTILLPWIPQTCAPLEKRKTAILALMKKHPDICWKLLISLMPSPHQTSTGSNKPVWREIIPDDWPKRTSGNEYWKQINAYMEFAFELAKKDLKKLNELIGVMDNLTPDNRKQVLSFLCSDSITSLPDEDRSNIWNALNNLISEHRKFEYTDWALKKDVVDEIDKVTNILKPSNPVYLYQRFFTQSYMYQHDDKEDYNEKQKLLEEQHQKAIIEILVYGGIEAILKFAQIIEMPRSAGFAAGENIIEEEYILPFLLESQEKSLLQFVFGYVLRIFQIYEWKWVDGIDLVKWTPSQIGQLLSFLPFIPETWDRAEKLLKNNESLYWQKADANPYAIKGRLDIAIEKLLKYGRPFDAICCMSKMINDKMPINNKQAIKVLKAILSTKNDLNTMRIFDIVETIKILQNDSDTNPEDLFQIEWAFFPLLNDQHNASPKLLEKMLVEKPDFFCELIRTVYRLKMEKKSKEEMTEQQERIARNAYYLLDNWRKPPGMREDGFFDEKILKNWLFEIKEKCKATGHLDVALNRVGHVLVYSPPDPDGLLIHHSVAEILNEEDNGKIREGFNNAYFNPMVFRAITPGKIDLSLYNKYRSYAEEIEKKGYIVFATSLRELADSQKRSDEHLSSIDPFDND